MLRPSSDKADEEPGPVGNIERRLARSLKAAGWSLHAANPPAAFSVAKGGKRYPLLIRWVRDARRSIIQALIADAILRGRAGLKENFVVVVAAPSISPAMARAIHDYVAEVAPDQPFGYVDDRGLVRFLGLGLDPVQGVPD